MSTYSPIEHAESLCIGTVDFISPDEIKVLLDIEAPEAVSLNTGFPRPFPRVNDYVLIPSDDGHIVGQIEWLAIERSPHPKRKGMHDFGLIDLPYPMRKMSLNPVGVLTSKRQRVENEEVYELRRGVNSFPSVGTQVLLPTQEQLRAIIESGEGRKVKIGTSPLADNADVRVSPDRLFGRHLAVLGNTGSGKSCSVAGIIRWSLEVAQKALKSKRRGKLNARFIVLDPNGEYSRAFHSVSNHSNIKARIFKVSAGDGEENLRVPLWFWNSAEWSVFTQASGRSQRPLLRRALREVKSGRVNLLDGAIEEKKLELRRRISSYSIEIKRACDVGTIRDEETKFGYRLKAIQSDLESNMDNFHDYVDDIRSIAGKIQSVCASSYKKFTNQKGEDVEYYRAFSENDVNSILACLSVLLNKLGGIVYAQGPSEDMPIPFSGTDIADHLQILAEQENVTQYLDFLIMRIRTLLSDTRAQSIISDKENLSLTQWLSDHLGKGDTENGDVSIIDLSLVPSEIIHTITAVISRMIFESLQRYRKLSDEILPTVMVVEEAHTFVKRYKNDAENQDAASVCCQVFEKIAREGRKFGLGLVVSSQRPSELSPTVLSQCNTFLLHRISNDRDQDLVRRFIPDNLKGLLRDLPSLPSQHAILMGWASELPLLVKMNDLPKEQQPQSDDPDFWNVWTGASERAVDWKKIADDWQGKESVVGQQESENKDSQGESGIDEVLMPANR